MAVVKFILSDLDSGLFIYYDVASPNQFTFPVNPTEYNISEDEAMTTSKSIDGTQTVIQFPFAETSREMSWQRISRTFYLALRERYRSGNRFVLLDHNYESVIGRITGFNFDEIVATVPSEYKGSLTFTGIGKQ